MFASAHLFLVVFFRFSLFLVLLLTCVFRFFSFFPPDLPPFCPFLLDTPLLPSPNNRGAYGLAPLVRHVTNVYVCIAGMWRGGVAVHGGGKEFGK